MGVSSFALGFTEALGGLFALAAMHKIAAVLTGRSANEALLRTSARRQEAASWLTFAAMLVEAGVVAAIILDPRIGLSAALVLLAIYWRELGQLRPEQTCACFGAIAQTPARAARARNAALGWGALVSLLVLVFVHVPEPSWRTVSVAVVILSVVTVPPVLLAQTSRAMSRRET